MKSRLLLAVSVVVALAATAWAADPKLEGVKCIMNGKAPAKAEKSAEYKGGKVFFCCDNCPKGFAADPAKHATKANLQLALTGQTKQEKCPFSGQPVDASKSTKVSGVDVAFCCDGCKGKVEKSKPEDAVELVFADKAFDKGFKVTK